MYFFTFLFNSMRDRANDPTNDRYWLPNALENADDPDGAGKLLPLTEHDWQMGEIKGDEATIITTNIVNQANLVLVFMDRAKAKLYKPMNCPDEPYPKLSFPQLTVMGLQNVWLDGKPPVKSSNRGYQTTITFQFGYYDETLVTDRLSIIGDYKLLECLCLADKKVANPTQCAEVAGGRYSADGNGTFLINFTDTFVDAELDILVASSEQAPILQVKITQLHVRGSTVDADPLLRIPDGGLTIDTEMDGVEPFWIAAATNAITSTEGRTGIFDNLNQALNKESELATLSRLLTGQLTHALDDIMGTVPGALPTLTPAQIGPGISNPVDIYLYQRIQASLNNPASEFYLPKVLVNIDDPRLEPFHIDRIDLPDQRIMGMPFTNIQLQGINFVGVANIASESDEAHFNEIEVDGEIRSSFQGVVLIGAEAAKLDGSGGRTIPPPPVRGNGNFTLTPIGMAALTGSFTLSLQATRVRFEMVTGGRNVDELSIILTSLSIDIEPNNMTITLNIDSAFEAIINQAINTPDIKRDMIGQINDALQKDLATISQQVTQATRLGIGSRLDR